MFWAEKAWKAWGGTLDLSKTPKMSWSWQGRRGRLRSPDALLCPVSRSFDELVQAAVENSKAQGDPDERDALLWLLPRGDPGALSGSTHPPSLVSTCRPETVTRHKHTHPLTRLGSRCRRLAPLRPPALGHAPPCSLRDPGPAVRSAHRASRRWAASQELARVLAEGPGRCPGGEA